MITNCFIITCFDMLVVKAATFTSSRRTRGTQSTIRTELPPAGNVVVLGMPNGSHKTMVHVVKRQHCAFAARSVSEPIGLRAQLWSSIEAKKLMGVFAEYHSHLTTDAS